MKKANGYIRWFFVALAVAGLIWNAAALHYKVSQTNAILENDIQHISKSIDKIEQRLEKIEERLWEFEGDRK